MFLSKILTLWNSPKKLSKTKSWKVKLSYLGWKIIIHSTVNLFQLPKDNIPFYKSEIYFCLDHTSGAKTFSILPCLDMYTKHKQMWNVNASLETFRG